MGHAGCEQTDGGELLSLRELRLHVDAIGDVVHDDDAPHRFEISRQQRGDCNVCDALFAVRQRETELIQRVHPVLGT